MYFLTEHAQKLDLPDFKIRFPAYHHDRNEKLHLMVVLTQKNFEPLKVVI